MHSNKRILLIDAYKIIIRGTEERLIEFIPLFEKLIR